MRQSISRWVRFGCFTLALAPGSVAAADRAAVEAERLGLVPSATALDARCLDRRTDLGVFLCPEPPPAVLPVRDPAAAARARQLLGTTGLLLVTDSGNDRVMAFDAATGDLVDANFVPADPTHLSTPKSAILDFDGTSILVSDQVDDVVQRYDLDGNYVGFYAPAGGPNTAILDNILGIAFRPNGSLLVAVDGGANADAIAEFDATGTYVGNFVANGAGGLDAPFDVYGRAGDWLVSAITSDNILQYDLAGAFVADLESIDDFPQQIAEAANGNLLIGNFSGIQVGVVELTPAGVLVDVHTGVVGNRGVYELPNGNILTTNGGGVFEIDRADNLVETKLGGVNAHYIELAFSRPEVLVPGIVSFPTLDGSLAPGEWDGAVDLEMGLGASPVTLYLAHRGAGLFFAVDDQQDSTLDALDRVALYFDDEGGTSPALWDGYFANPACGAPNTGEGNFWLGNLAPEPDDQWREWITGPAQCTVQLGATGSLVAYDDAAGHVVYEGVIRFGSSALGLAAGQTIGLQVRSEDQGAAPTGRFPVASVADQPATYALVTLDGLLFADGFESSDTSWWSQLVP